MSELHLASVAELRAGLDARTYSAVELARHFLDRIDRHNPALNAVVTVTGDIALRDAQAADARIASGESTPLLGIPVLHKDLFCTDGVRTACGSRMLGNFRAPYDATVVANVRAAGGVMLGKTNMDEFAMGSSTESSIDGPARNPWDTARVPGGSSGGSAAAVAAALAPLATGTDTGGSIRQPAALCGLTGIKPTYGRVSRHGMVAFASSLDQAGAFGRTAEDAGALLAAMAGFDARDSTSFDRPADEVAMRGNGRIEGLRVGVARQGFGAGLDAGVETSVRAALAELERLGATLVDIELPHTDAAISAYYVVAPAEASSNLSRFDGVRYGYRCEEPVDLADLYARSRSEGFGAEVKRRIMLGTFALSTGYYDAYYKKAQAVRQLVANDFRAAFEQVDVIAAPTSPFPAFELGAMSDDPVAMYLCDVNTVGVNLAGLPSLSLPVATTRPTGAAGPLPVGLQLTANYYAEAALLDVAHAIQRETDWHHARPEGFA